MFINLTKYKIKNKQGEKERERNSEKPGSERLSHAEKARDTKIVG